jgi:hypothetical protein
MNGIRFAENVKVQPILAPADVVATATPTKYIDLDGVNWATFLVQFGTLTSTDSTGEVVITVEASTAGSSNATEGNVTFHYRLSGAVDTDSMGAVTAATASGAAINNTAGNKVVVIDVDPSVVAASAADRRFVRLVLTPTAEITATVVGAVAILDTRHKSTSIPSST